MDFLKNDGQICILQLIDSQCVTTLKISILYPLIYIIYIRGIKEWYKMDKGEGLEGG